ncbi:MAG TPA: HAD family phosphatase [Terriglobia bacterium]|nr:HAD family phosphatase [Terriglobia bacterium]
MRYLLLRAIIFDFDGIIVDSEPLIMRLTQQMAAQQGWLLTEEEYYRDYLALDDRGIIEHLYRTHELECDPRRRDELVEWKARTYMEAIGDGLPPMPGAVEFVRMAAERYPLAIASGSMRHEIEYLLGKLGLRDAFHVIASAEDTERSKPNPQIYICAIERLRQLPAFSGSPLHAGDCVAIEDAPAGVRAAHAAGMKCIAITHSRPSGDLLHADVLFQGFPEIDLDSLARLGIEKDS